ncbi:hypothetical protein ABN028_19440 [Actinopolymorpha sp. B17G11]|uniref:hypothetical protein n=1 Tax=Actinopolymorpha sp. B17G11 TaxID=3160861 RepID=UPI0032E47EB6
MADTLAAAQRRTGPGATLAGRPPKGERPPTLDREEIQARENRYVERQVADLVTADAGEAELEAAAKKLGRIRKAALRAIEEYRPVRDAAALSLALNDGVRGVYGVAGFNRSYFVRMRQEALAAGGAKVVRGAAKKLVEAAGKVAQAEARIDAVRPVRDVVANRLIGEFSWTRRAVADLMGVTEGAIAQRVRQRSA